MSRSARRNKYGDKPGFYPSAKEDDFPRKRARDCLAHVADTIPHTYGQGATNGKRDVKRNQRAFPNAIDGVGFAKVDSWSGSRYRPRIFRKGQGFV